MAKKKVKQDEIRPVPALRIRYNEHLAACVHANAKLHAMLQKASANPKIRLEISICFVT